MNRVIEEDAFTARLVHISQQVHQEGIAQVSSLTNIVDLLKR